MDDDRTHIRLERKGETKSEWAINELDHIHVAMPKSIWSTGYLRFVRAGHKVEPGEKYSPHSDPDAVVVTEVASLQAAAALLERKGGGLGVPIVVDGETHQSSQAVGATARSVRTKKGHEVVRLSETAIAIDDGRLELDISDIDEIRVKNSTFGLRFLQLVRKGDISAWPDTLPDSEFPNAVDTSPVYGTESWNSFLRIIESLYPERLVRLHKREERDAALQKLYARSTENTGEITYSSPVSRAFGIKVYSREIWLGDPFRANSIGGPIAGAHAEYSVSGNIVTSTRTVSSLAGNTHVQRPQDERIFQLKIIGPSVSIAATASANSVSDSGVVELVNAINAAAAAASRRATPTPDPPLPPKPRRQPSAGADTGTESQEGLRRLMKLYAAGLIDEAEFAQGRADLE